jgi:Protein of unknown function (DUF3592)
MINSSKTNWQLATANIYSAEWIDPTRNDFGHYTVTYTYHAGEEIYTGEFRDYVSQTEPYLKRDDVIQIRYNPLNPKKSFYPEVHSATNRRLFFISLGLALAIIVMVIVYLNGGFK